MAIAAYGTSSLSRFPFLFNDEELVTFNVGDKRLYHNASDYVLCIGPWITEVLDYEW